MTDEQKKQFQDDVLALAHKAGVETLILSFEDRSGARIVSSSVQVGDISARAMMAARTYGAVREQLEEAMHDQIAAGRGARRGKR